MKKLQFTLLISLLCSACVVWGQVKETRNVDTFTKLTFRMPGKLYLRQGSTQKVEIEGKKEVLQDLATEVEGGKLVIGKERKWDNWKWKDGDEIIVHITVKDLDAVSVSGSGDLIGENKITARDLNLNVSGSGNMTIEAEASGHMEGDVSGSGELNVKGKCKSFDSDVSGSGRVTMVVNIAEEADFGISGSGRIMAKGTASQVKAAISGSGKVLASELETNRCEVRISGSGDVEIHVKNEIDASISGSGTVSYKGNPSKVNSHSTGSGHLRKL